MKTEDGMVTKIPLLADMESVNHSNSLHKTFQETFTRDNSTTYDGTISTCLPNKLCDEQQPNHDQCSRDRLKNEEHHNKIDSTDQPTDSM